MIVESIRKLGFKPEDIKIIINGHGHSDHAGAFAYFKKLTNAQIAIMEADVPMVEDGGKCRQEFWGNGFALKSSSTAEIDASLIGMKTQSETFHTPRLTDARKSQVKCSGTTAH